MTCNSSTILLDSFQRLQPKSVPRLTILSNMIFKYIATGLIIAAAFLKLVHENRVTTLKLPCTFGLCAYLLTELYSISKNVKFICDASQILKTLHHAHPERQGNV